MKRSTKRKVLISRLAQEDLGYKNKMSRAYFVGTLLKNGFTEYTPDWPSAGYIARDYYQRGSLYVVLPPLGVSGEIAVIVREPNGFTQRFPDRASALLCVERLCGFVLKAA